MKAVLLASLALMLAACEGEGYSRTTTSGGIVVSNGASEGEVREIALRDGTRCAVLVGGYKGGITCDWGHAPKTP